MKFIADNMVGKLAKYLRVAGYDVKYPKNLSDNKIIDIAESENRLILTRDSNLITRKKIKKDDIQFLFIESQEITRQLKQVKEELSLNIYPAFKRCIICNNELHNVDKRDVRGKVPDYVYKTKNNFFFCKKCNKIYWKGSHYKAMKQLLEKIDCTW